ncbi:MAG: PH domain-containing protein [Acidobacteriota bacterium]
MSDSSKQTTPNPPVRGSFLSKAGRWAVATLAAAIVLCAAVLWLYNRNFTTEAPVVRASRFTSGNRVFPVQVAVFADRVSNYSPRFLGHTENSITLRQIASVKVKSGPVFADVVIDTAGGSPPVVIHGLWKKDAEALSANIATAQAKSSFPVRAVEPGAAAATAPATAAAPATH